LTRHQLILDSFEQQIERPIEYEDKKNIIQKKRKLTPEKNQLIILTTGADIVDIKIGEPGSISDFNLFKKQQQKFELEHKFKRDKAYVGGFDISTPHKKPKKQELSSAQKEDNKNFSRQRIFVKHLIGKIKFFRIAAERFRLHRSNYEQVISAVCGLVRLRIGALILPT
jgi:DDE superfamily endonuclease